MCSPYKRSKGERIEAMRSGLRPIRKTTVDDLLGLLPWTGPAKSLEEMEDAIAKGSQEAR